MSEGQSGGGPDQSGGQPLVQVSVSDVFGVGKAVASAAGQEVMRALGSIVTSVTDPLRTRLLGKANSANAKDALVAVAADSRECDQPWVVSPGDERLSSGKVQAGWDGKRCGMRSGGQWHRSQAVEGA